MSDRPGGTGPEGPQPPPGRVRTTSAPTLAVSALLGALVGGAVPPLVERTGGTVPTVSWLSVLTLLFVAVVLGALAWTTWRTLHRRRQRIDSQRAVNLLVLGKASALTGAAFAGGYFAFALTFLGETQAALPRERLVHGLLAAAAAVALATGGLALERACRVPDDRDGTDGTAEPDGTERGAPPR